MKKHPQLPKSVGFSEFVDEADLGRPSVVNSLMNKYRNFEFKDLFDEDVPSNREYCLSLMEKNDLFKLMEKIEPPLEFDSGSFPK